jgi:hypothetical protein
MAKKSLEPIAQFGQTAATTPKPGQQPAMPFQQQVVVRQAAPASAPLEAPTDAVLQLLWVDETVRPEIRRQPEWRSIVDAIAGDADLGLDAALARAQPDAADTARSVFELLTRASVTSIASLGTVLRESVRPDGKLSPPLAVVGGRLELVRDPVAKLELAAQLAEPFRGASAELDKAMAGIEPYVKEPRGVVGGADTLCRQLFTAVQAHVPSLPAEHLEARVDRLLVEERRYILRDVLGAPHVLGQLDGVPVYLPEAAALELPLSAALSARMLVEIHPRLDDGESHPIALAVRAAARRLDM